MLNQGIKAYIDPFAVGASTVTDNASAPLHLAGLSLWVKAQLKPNNVALDNPLAPMLLLGNFLADGELKIAAKDFQTILSLLPPDVASLAKNLAIRDGEKILFRIRYENGGLTVNGMPIM